MKHSPVLLLATAVLAFGLGWWAKPLPDPAAATPPPTATPAPQVPAPPTPAAPAPPPPLPPGGMPAPGGPAAAAADLREQAVAAKDAAKMQRFAEALGLSADQQADLTQLIARSLKPASPGQSAAPAGPNDVLDQLAARAAALEQGLAKLLTPEQSAAFAELRQREHANRGEATAQRELANLSEVTDLTAAQRATVLTELRKANAAEPAAVPAPLALILDSSVLPLGPLAPSAQAIHTLRLLNDGETPGDPAALHDKLIADQQRQRDARLTLLKGILTPAQFAQYQASVGEQNAIRNVMSPPRW